MPAAARSGGYTIEHSAAGLRELVAVLAGRRPEVAIERPDGPVVDALLDAGITVVVISPNQVKNLRGRYGSAGNKDDRFDAFVLADTLRTDRARLRPLTPTARDRRAAPRPAAPARISSAHRVAVANQLRAHLQNVLPGAVGLFAEIDCPISLGFLTRFGTQDSADWLTPAGLASGWPASATAAAPIPPCCTPAWPPRPAAPPATSAPPAPITRALLAVLTTLTGRSRP